MAEQIVIEFIADSSQLLPTIELLQKAGVITKEDLETFNKLSAQGTKSLEAITASGKKMLPTLGQIQTGVSSIAETFIDEFQNTLQSSLLKSNTSLQQFIKQLQSVKDQTPLTELQQELAETLIKLSDLSTTLSQIKQKEALQIELQVATDPNAIALLQKQITGLTKFGTDKQTIGGLQQEFAANLEGAQQLAAQIDKLKTAEDKASASQGTFRAQLRATTESLAQRLAAGELTVSELYREAQAAGVMRDAMGDATKTIAALASDTFTLDAIGQGVSALTSSFQVFAGISALVGDENKDLQKTLVQLNAVMSISQGIAQVTNSLQKDSAFILKGQIVLERTLNFIRTGSFATTKQIVAASQADVVAKEAETVATTELTVATTASSIAMQAFRVALLATGIGAVVILVGALVSAFSEFSSGARDAADAEKDLADTIEKTNESLRAQIDFINRSGDASIDKIKTELDLAEKRGASDKEVFAIREKLYKQEQTTAKQALDAAIARAEKEEVNVSNSIKGYEALQNASHFYFTQQDALNNQRLNDLKDLADAQRKNDKDGIESAQRNLAATEANINQAKSAYELYGGVLKQVSDTEISLQALAAEKSKYYSDKSAEAAKKAADERKKLSEQQKQNEEKDAQAELEITQLRLTAEANVAKAIADNEKNSLAVRIKALQDYQKLQEQIINNQRAFDLANKNLTDKQKELVNVKADQQLIQLARDTQKTITDIEKQAGDKRIDNAEAAVKDRINRTAELENQALIQLARQYENGEITYAEYEKRKSEIGIEFAKKTVYEQIKAYEKLLDDPALSPEKRTEIEQKITDLKKQAIDQDVENHKNANEKITADAQAAAEKMQEVFENSLQVIQTGIQSLGNNFSSGVASAVLSLFSTLDKETDGFTVQIKDVSKVLAATFVTTQAVVNAAYQQAYEQRQAQVQSEIDKLEERKNEELSNAQLTADQRAIIEKKYAAQEGRIKADAAKKQRQADISQAIVNGLLAAGNALATVKPFIPAGLIAAALAVTLTGFQISQIKSTPLPQFRKGTQHAPAGYAIVGEEGPEIVKLRGGEKIYTHTESRIIEKHWERENYAETNRVLKESKMPVLLEGYQWKNQNNSDNFSGPAFISPTDVILKMIPRPIDKEIIEASNRNKDIGQLKIDYDLLADKIGERVAMHQGKIEDIPESGLVEQAGEIYKWIQKKKEHTIYLNKKGKLTKQ